MSGEGLETTLWRVELRFSQLVSPQAKGPLDAALTQRSKKGSNQGVEQVKTPIAGLVPQLTVPVFAHMNARMPSTSFTAPRRKGVLLPTSSILFTVSGADHPCKDGCMTLKLRCMITLSTKMSGESDSDHSRAFPPFLWMLLKVPNATSGGDDHPPSTRATIVPCINWLTPSARHGASNTDDGGECRPLPPTQNDDGEVAMTQKYLSEISLDWRLGSSSPQPVMVTLVAPTEDVVKEFVARLNRWTRYQQERRLLEEAENAFYYFRCPSPALATTPVDVGDDDDNDAEWSTLSAHKWQKMISQAICSARQNAAARGPKGRKRLRASSTGTGDGEEGGDNDGHDPVVSAPPLSMSLDDAAMTAVCAVSMSLRFS